MLEQNKNVARRYVEEVWNKGNVAAIDETHSESYLHHDAHDPWQRTHGPGPDAQKEIVHFYRDAFPDLRLTLDEMVAEGDVVVARFTSHSTHTKELAGHKPTHKKVKLTGVFWWRFADGKIAEGRHFWDAQGLLRQIGALPDLPKM